MAKEPERLLSLNELSRELGISWPKALRLSADGILVPDYVGSQSQLFRQSRIPELKRVIANHDGNTGLNRAIAANTANQAKRK